jgi:hypothetical protein
LGLLLDQWGLVNMLLRVYHILMELKFHFQYRYCCVLTEMASGDSGTASDSSNIGSTVGAFVGGAIGSLAGPAVSEQVAAIGASIGGAIAGIEK